MAHPNLVAPARCTLLTQLSKRDRLASLPESIATQFQTKMADNKDEADLLESMSKLLRICFVVFSKQSPQRIFGADFSSILVFVRENSFCYSHLTCDQRLRYLREENDAFQRLGPDPVNHIFNFLGKREAFKAKAVNKHWNVHRINWDPKHEPKHPLLLHFKDPNSFFFQLFQNSPMGLEITLFHKECRRLGFLPLTFTYHGETFKELPESAITDDHYQLLEAIAKRDVKTFLEILERSKLDVNYFIHGISPRLLAEIFPEKTILEKLRHLRTTLMPKEIANEYMSASLAAMHRLPLITEIFAQ